MYKLYTNVYSNIFILAEKLKQPINWQMDKQNVLYPFPIHEREWNTNTC